MKFLLMMNVPGRGPYQIDSWPEADIKARAADLSSDDIAGFVAKYDPRA